MPDLLYRLNYKLLPLFLNHYVYGKKNQTSAKISDNSDFNDHHNLHSNVLLR